MAATPTGAAGEPVEKPAPAEEAKRRSGPRDGFLLLCIAAVSAAIGMMLYAQMGLSLPAAVGAALGAWIVFLLVHKQVQKTAQIKELQAELARARFQASKARTAPQRGAQPSPMAPGMPSRQDVRQPDFASVMARSETAAQAAARVASGLTSEMAPQRPANSDAAPVRAPSAPAQRGAPQSPAKGASESPAPASTEAAASIDVSGMRMPPNTGSAPQTSGPANGSDQDADIPSPRPEIIRDQWSFRPRSDSKSGGAPASMRPVSTVEGDLELVQRKIRELADEVNFVEASRPSKPQQHPDARPNPTTDAIEHSIGALKAAASTMRERPNLGDFIPQLAMPPAAKTPAPKPQTSQQGTLPGLGELVIPDTAERIAGAESMTSGDEPTVATGALPDLPEPRLDLPLPKLPQLDLSLGSASAGGLPPRGREIARAVENATMDIFLTPIVTLSAHAVNHYEMTVALKSADGARVEARDEDFTLIGRELGAKFDIDRLHRAAALAVRMEARDKDGSLLTSIMGSSLSNRAFLEAIAKSYEERPKLASQLVVTLTQRAIDDFTPTVWQALRDMQTFGFRFALDKIEHMRTDFAALVVAGFRFIRLEPQMLFDGFAVPDRFVPANEIYQRATLAGLSIIADGVVDAKSQKRLLEVGVDLGQGALFGVPRQVMLDDRAKHSAAA
jgi:cyclic-di-GMP phosphodiesterase TipF (flagellum assembly factor)